MATIKYKETKYGFQYGNAEVTRLHSDPQKGSVVLGIKTSKEDLQVYVTKTGKVRISNIAGDEWIKPGGG